MDRNPFADGRRISGCDELDDLDSAGRPIPPCGMIAAIIAIVVCVLGSLLYMHTEF
jgi:hypothetical protein